MTKLCIIGCLLIGLFLAGCGGSGEIKVSDGKLTDDQKEQIKRTDKEVADEESQGAKRR